jgi:CRP-like cAMP-binding protein
MTEPVRGAGSNEVESAADRIYATLLFGSDDLSRMSTAQNQHLAWMARSFGRPDYLPLGPDDVAALQNVAEPISRYTGSHLFKEGEPAVAAYLIRSGEVDLYRMHSGRRRVVARVGPGAVIGDIAMFGEGTYMSSARAVNQVKAFRFDRETLIPELARHPALCLRWLVSGLRQLQDTQRRIVHLMHMTVIAQVADLLVEESTKGKKEIELSQAAIATLLGSSRQTVNEAIGELRDIGAIETGYRAITVLDPKKLADVAAGRRN